MKMPSPNRFKELFQEVQAEHKQTSTFSLNDKVLIVDGHNNYLRNFCAVPTMNEMGEHVGGVSGFLKSIGSAIRMFRPTRCIITFDGPGGSQRRRKLYPEYKENRKHLTRLNRTYDFKDKDDEDKALTWQLIALAHLLKCLPVTVLAPSNVEADDVIAYTADLIQQRDGHSIIMSTDKDFLQLVNEHIEIWNPIKKKAYYPQTVIDEYGIHPNNFTIYRALDGDKSDNISGVKGIGLKTLIKHYPTLVNEEMMDVNALIDYAERQDKGKLFESIRRNRDLIELNFKLMNLHQVQMSTSTKMSVMNRIDSANFELNKTELTKQLAELQMLGVFGNYDAWILNTWHPLIRFSNKE